MPTQERFRHGAKRARTARARATFTKAAAAWRSLTRCAAELIGNRVVVFLWTQTIMISLSGAFSLLQFRPPVRLRAGGDPTGSRPGPVGTFFPRKPRLTFSASRVHMAKAINLSRD